ncbi:MAG: protoheme IX farnesyltransferase [Desulfuromonas sp.]|nr:MAG: protoheme IX farnesyltransferase [Desulfuromonas sp.]
MNSTPHTSLTADGGRGRANHRRLLLLVRPRLSLMVACSTWVGFLLADSGPISNGIIATAAILQLSAASSIINQWQERSSDARMERTRLRPLAAGTLSPAQGLSIALVLATAGVLLLLTLPSPQPLIFGLLAILWYNGVYTPLKKMTPFAVIPGALCGALPPLIGWAASGQSALSTPPLLLAGTLIIWQVPHFWLLASRHRADHGKSGLPDIFQAVAQQTFYRIIGCWLAALFSVYLLFPLLGLVRHPALSVLYLVALSGILVAGFGVLRTPLRESDARLFLLVNLSLLLLFAVLITDRLLGV